MQFSFTKGMEIYLYQTIMFTQNLSIGTSFSILRVIWTNNKGAMTKLEYWYIIFHFKSNMDKQQRGYDKNDLVFESCLANNAQSSVKLWIKITK